MGNMWYPRISRASRLGESADHYDAPGGAKVERHVRSQSPRGRLDGFNLRTLNEQSIWADQIVIELLTNS